MVRLLALSTLIAIGLGTSACSHFEPYDYSQQRVETPAEREARQASEARERQQQTVRCQTGARNVPGYDCN
ncbi:hypothetical protein [uncultured Brevundimonas sp.]|uniref:hypothetical protein n=1 Tax=uncultured Brevundimonas sp. TaxID=213418 RepID=UPI002614FBCB|nr:hypothetical protein [uncultured Brevundimonas sp.]